MSMISGNNRIGFGTSPYVASEALGNFYPKNINRIMTPQNAGQFGLEALGYSPNSKITAEQLKRELFLKIAE